MPVESPNTMGLRQLTGPLEGRCARHKPHDDVEEPGREKRQRAAHHHRLRRRAATPRVLCIAPRGSASGHVGVIVSFLSRPIR